MLCLDPLTSVRAAVCFSPHEMYVTLCVLRAASSVGSPVSGVIQGRERERERRSTYVQINQDLTSHYSCFQLFNTYSIGQELIVRFLMANLDITQEERIYMWRRTTYFTGSKVAVNML